MRDQCVNFWRYTLLAFLCISIVAAFFVLGVDLDWLLNGPEFVAKVWSRIKERWAIIFPYLVLQNVLHSYLLSMGNSKIAIPTLKK